GFSKGMVILPFKGVYLKYTGDQLVMKTHIYPVPNLANPFLGVHYTVTVDGVVKIGPTAIPAFWRENYQGWSRFRVREFFQVLYWEILLFLKNSFGFRDLALTEFKKYRKSVLRKLARKMVRDMDEDYFSEWSRPGIRAQLLETSTLKLIQDFVVQGDDHSIHLLNAVSPAFTCSFPIARYVVDRIPSPAGGHA
ncbi:MAG: NAD(P)/FAD-dependent oxidoreductase, partial [Bdellovibrionota bacterium]